MHVPKGRALQPMYSHPEAIYFVVKGTIEVSFNIDGNHKFVVEKLERGSVINIRGIFMEDTIMVDYLATE